MMRNTLISLAAVSVFTLASTAQAATIRVKCEVRGDRSVISVDGKNLAAGDYSAIAMSGANTAHAGAQTAQFGEAEFDFASNANDIAQGATAVPTNFITGGTVTGKILNAAGDTVISDTVACRVKSK